MIGKVFRKWVRRILLVGPDGLIVALLKCIRRGADQSGKGFTLTYYPAFPNPVELANHYYRAAWYLPPADGLIATVNFFTRGKFPVGKRPEYFSPEDLDISHMRLKQGRRHFFKSLVKSRLILVWAQKNDWFLSLLRKAGVTIVNVGTNDLEAREFGAYPGIIWRFLLSAAEKRRLHDENYKKFKLLCDEVRASAPKNAVVCGNGPSLDDSFKFDFRNSFVLACNTVIKNKELFRHLNPRLITGGDSVSHVGVSAYAGQYRRDLLRTLAENPGLYYLGLSHTAYILVLQYPRIASRCIFIEQGHKGPVYDFLEIFQAPNLDSTMNIHLLPAAATICRDIFLIGCDGKVPKEDNEDFWKHSTSAQYHDLVYTGHLCHPTFDVHRQRITYTRYLDSIRQTVLGGEARGKRYVSLSVSYVPELAERSLTPRWYGDNFSAGERQRLLLEAISEKLQAPPEEEDEHGQMSDNKK